MDEILPGNPHDHCTEGSQRSGNRQSLLSVHRLVAVGSRELAVPHKYLQTAKEPTAWLTIFYIFNPSIEQMNSAIGENRKNVKSFFTQRVLEHVLIEYQQRSFSEPTSTCSISAKSISMALFSINAPFADDIHPFFRDETIMRAICFMLSSEIKQNVEFRDDVLLLQYPVVP
jgi:hypothetical protein